MSWAARTPPGPLRRELPRLFRKLVTDRLGLLTEAAALGDAVRVTLGPRTLYVFNHPDYAKHVLADNSAAYHKGIGLTEARRALGDGLLTSEGELWRTQRRAAQPAFQHQHLAAQADVIVEETAKLIARLRAQESGAPVDFTQELTELTLGVLGRTLLHTDLTAYGTVGHAFEAVQDQAMFEMVTQGMVPLWAPLPQQRRFHQARAELRRVVDQLVAERTDRPAESPADDVLSRLIDSTRREPDPEVGRRRLHDDLVTLLLAGHETTASTLGWTFHLLDRHPEAAARVREEARGALGDRAPVLGDLHALPYTGMVVQEAMRLYPPVWILPRRAQRADDVGGYHVPVGTDVLICPYTLHRHPEFWAEPERFDPERFDPARPADRPRYAYIPFGGGPRFCIGSNLGMTEAVLVTAMIARELTLRTVPGREVVPEPMLSLRVRDGLRVEVRAAAQ
ncbi:cytochrome P450 [Streptomyces clavuligerus]|uniref:Putative P450 hydroxylase n=1 Tax=Streptomyces clavuligerus TaxID=1901 RepID=B5H1E4_STRCL|nr:cytochrome P450 [Streptomyces clavuligerus]EDY52390.1 cytochrome P450 [Streptomyces clavuligerus]EFG04837.1 Putative P450 hydroxylase [Streptomyces clavuligerus]MBY6306717.1 cytochrome P450 [Streptomyces clavuligerus]QCS10675.1 cytochrome P450 [Streptomyces clavuligerus]QPJ97288.1 cytochrome P450 [Streptomyces clavuligerus]